MKCVHVPPAANFIYIERERETDRQTDRQTLERERERETDRQTLYIYIERERQRETETETDRQTDRQKNKALCDSWTASTGQRGLDKALKGENSE